MIPGFIYFFIFIIFLYSYVNYQGQISVTAAAIRQIWSGSCMLSCRRSQYSSYSGFSSFQEYQVPQITGQPATRNQFGIPPRQCVCASCPCELIDDFLRSNNPVSRVISTIMFLLTNAIYLILKALTDLFESMTNVVGCRAACQQRQLQAVFNRSDDNFSFSNPRTIDSARSAQKGSPIYEDPIERGLSKSSIQAEAGSSKGKKKDKDKRAISEETLKPSTCSKCLLEGKVCISECPRAKKMSEVSVTKKEDKRIAKKEGDKDIQAISQDTLKPPKDSCVKCTEKGIACINDCPKVKKKKREQYFDPSQLPSTSKYVAAKRPSTEVFAKPRGISDILTEEKDSQEDPYTRCYRKRPMACRNECPGARKFVDIPPEIVIIPGMNQQTDEKREIVKESSKNESNPSERRTPSILDDDNGTENKPCICIKCVASMPCQDECQVPKFINDSPETVEFHQASKCNLLGR